MDDDIFEQVDKEIIMLKKAVPNYIDSDRLLKLTIEYKNLLESGISYQELISLYEMDKEIFLLETELIFLRIFDKRHEADYQTAIGTFTDERDMLLAINLAYGMLNHEIEEKDEQSLKMMMNSK